MHTQRFGTLEIVDGQATLPSSAGLQGAVTLDVSEAQGDATALTSLAAFLDQLPDHLAGARPAFIEGYDGIAPDVPLWLAEEQPEAYAKCFPALDDPMKVTPVDCWEALRVESINAAGTFGIIVRMGFPAEGAEYIYEVAFDQAGVLDRIELYH